MKNFSSVAAALVAVGVVAAGALYLRSKSQSHTGGVAPGKTRFGLPWGVNVYNRPPLPPPVGGYAPPPGSIVAADINAGIGALRQLIDLSNQAGAAGESSAVQTGQASAYDTTFAQLGAGASSGPDTYPADLAQWT